MSIHFMCAYVYLHLHLFVIPLIYWNAHFKYIKSTVVFIRSSKVWFKTISCAKGPVTRCNFPGNFQRNSTLKQGRIEPIFWPMHQPEMRCNNGNRRRHRTPKARASRGVWGNAHLEKFWNLEPWKCDFPCVLEAIFDTKQCLKWWRLLCTKPKGARIDSQLGQEHF